MNDDTVIDASQPAKWLKSLCVALVVTIAGLGGGAVGTASTQRSANNYAPAIETLVERQTETTKRVDGLTDRITQLENAYSAQGNALTAATETMRDLVQEVRENGKSISKMAGILEKSQK